MNTSRAVASREQSPVLNAVPLQKAVLCAECDVLSDSPQDTCLVCGSHSLFNVARIFGGNLPKQRASLITREQVDSSQHDLVLVFPKPHRPRRRTAITSRQMHIVALDDNEMDQPDRALLAGPQSR